MNTSYIVSLRSVIVRRYKSTDYGEQRLKGNINNDLRLHLIRRQRTIVNIKSQHSHLLTTSNKKKVIAPVRKPF